MKIWWKGNKTKNPKAAQDNLLDEVDNDEEESKAEEAASNEN